ncbi:MAG: FkbM family methyltransferase [Nitrososphaerota archaeon]|nr:FkbM family methyltransferase [Nitrososphaerota archaeon]
MTKTRFLVLRHWLLNNKNDVTASELIKFFFDNSYHNKAKKFVQNIQNADLDFAIRIEGLPQPMFYPKDAFSLHALEQVLVEQYYPSNWHYYEIPETSVKEDDVVVDCGAAEGLFSLKACYRCKAVYAIEPLPNFVRALRRTFEPFPNVHVLPVAVSDHAGEGFIENRGISSSLSDGEGFRVQVDTLDNLFFERLPKITYIKADLEGVDYNALKGAENLIRHYSPKIAITTYHRPEDAAMMIDWIRSTNPNYKFRRKGIYQETGCPMMLHAWV